MLAIERRSSFVRFHAAQSVLLSAALLVWMLASVFLNLPRIPVFGFALYVVGPPAVLVLWLLAMVKAYRAERFSLPVIGRLAARISEWADGDPGPAGRD
jgi:uncharacterized membrane protein